MASRSSALRPHGGRLAVLVAGMLACVPADWERSPSDAVFASGFKDFDRKLQPLEQWRGRPMVVYFWATWCTSCERELPELIELYDKHRADGLQIVGIAIDNTDKVRAFTERWDLAYPILIGGNDALALSRELGNGVGGLPFTVTIDRAGNVTGTHLGELPPGRLEQLVAPLVS